MNDTPTVNSEPTVEECLKELREMFPVKVERNDYGSNKTPRLIEVERREYIASSSLEPILRAEARIYVQYASGGYSAPLIITASTLAECMAQVRKWKESQS